MADKTSNQTLADRFFKLVDHYRGTVIGAGAAALLVSFAGCQASATSPYSNQPATRSVIEAQRIDFEREQLLAKIKRENDAKRRIDAITAAAQQEVAQISADLAYGDQVDDAERAKLNAQADIAIADIDRRETMLVEGLRVLNEQPFVQSNPILGTALGFAGMFLGGGAMFDSRRKDKVIKQAKGTTQSGTDAA
jgi:hypothetical protein